MRPLLDLNQPRAVLHHPRDEGGPIEVGLLDAGDDLDVVRVPAGHEALPLRRDAVDGLPDGDGQQELVLLRLPLLLLPLGYRGRRHHGIGAAVGRPGVASELVAAWERRIGRMISERKK